MSVTQGDAWWLRLVCLVAQGAVQQCVARKAGCSILPAVVHWSGCAVCVWQPRYDCVVCQWEGSSFNSSTKVLLINASILFTMRVPVLMWCSTFSLLFTSPFCIPKESSRPAAGGVVSVLGQQALVQHRQCQAGWGFWANEDSQEEHVVTCQFRQLTTCQPRQQTVVKALLQKPSA